MTSYQKLKKKLKETQEKFDRADDLKRSNNIIARELLTLLRNNKVKLNRNFLAKLNRLVNPITTIDILDRNHCFLMDIHEIESPLWRMMSKTKEILTQYDKIKKLIKSLY